MKSIRLSACALLLLLASCAMTGVPAFAATARVTVDVGTKDILSTNTLSLGENALVLVKNLGDSDPADLLVSLHDRRSGEVLAGATNFVADVQTSVWTNWAWDGTSSVPVVASRTVTNAIGYLPLDTTNLFSRFVGLPVTAERSFILSVYDASNRWVLGQDDIGVKNAAVYGGLTNSVPGSIFSAYATVAMLTNAVNGLLPSTNGVLSYQALPGGYVWSVDGRILGGVFLDVIDGSSFTDISVSDGFVTVTANCLTSDTELFFSPSLDATPDDYVPVPDATYSRSTNADGSITLRVTSPASNDAGFFVLRDPGDTLSRTNAYFHLLTERAYFGPTPTDEYRVLTRGFAESIYASLSADIADANAAAMPRTATRVSGGSGIDPSTNSVTDFLWASNGVVSVRAANIQSLTDADGNDAYVSCLGDNLFSGGLFRPVVRRTGTIFIPGSVGIVTQGCSVVSTSVLWRSNHLACSATNYPQDVTDTNLFRFVSGSMTSFSPVYLNSIRQSSLVTNLLHVTPDVTADDLITVGLAYAGVTNYASIPYSSMTSAGNYALDISFVPGSFRAHNRQLMVAAASNSFALGKTAKHYYSGTNANPNRLFSALDTTCYSDMGATQAYNRTCTLITPQHCVCIGHWFPHVGTTMTWFDSSGGRHTASIAAITNLGSRFSLSPEPALAVCRLSAPVLGPTPARILSTNALPKLAGWTNNVVQAYNTCYIHEAGDTNRFSCDYVVEGLSTVTLTSTGIRTTRTQIPSSSLTLTVSPDTSYPAPPGWTQDSYGEYLATRFHGDLNSPFVGGNSGSPTLLYTNHDSPPILLSVLNLAYGSGPNVTAYGPILQDVIDAIGNTNAYRITFEDLAEWPSYDDE